ncbi:hypothetical protein [Pedosphaera parvula]|uniref:Uncharacterized protein n=1 Tax=Pedosphaera parvula (strain Ellin514) TaxID=320771 RepID=B9XD65_PEDPL|nr:hypothetical protein [Pedosphaera parvula]EEF62011.1 hypothetical protein Cflav_PD6286 [Pedosphaera parvula Ellin514]
MTLPLLSYVSMVKRTHDGNPRHHARTTTGRQTVPPLPLQWERAGVRENAPRLFVTEVTPTP